MVVNVKLLMFYLKSGEACSICPAVYGVKWCVCQNKKSLIVQLGPRFKSKSKVWTKAEL